MKPSDLIIKQTEKRINGDLELVWSTLCRLDCCDLRNHNYVKELRAELRKHLSNFTKEYYDFPDHIMPRQVD